jgi:3-isopropylmalate/(R)-2-methylmalate dehydratase large subunit
VPVLSEISDEKKRIAAERSLGHMGLKGGEKIIRHQARPCLQWLAPMRASKTCAEVARVVEGKKVSSSVNASDRAGLRAVKEQAEAEGLDKIFPAAVPLTGASCCRCVRHEPRQARAWERCASTSNGTSKDARASKGRTISVSPAMAAAAAIAGHFVDVRD